MRPVHDSYGRACLGRKQRNCNLLTGLELTFCPTFSAQNAWTIQFPCPVRDLAVGVLDIEVQLAMWIAPHEFRHDAVQYCWVRGFTSRSE